jgi:hypothetical protein
MMREWMLRGGAGLALVLLAACSGERASAPEPAPPPSRPAAPPVLPPAPPSAPAVTAMPRGILRLDVPLGEVATLKRQPDGTYKRVCAAPDREARAMLDGVMRSRRARP